jgi:hypothetical protein
MPQYLGKLKVRDGYLTIPDNAAIVDIENPSHNKAAKSRAKSKFTFWSRRNSDPLFAEGELTPESVHQGNLGDCWFLASVAAILRHPLGSQCLKGVMVDCHDGSVIVRLYDGDLIPHYVRVQKCRASYMGNKIGATNVTKTGMWPVILEKAGCCFSGDDREKFTPTNLSYSNIEQGFCRQGFRMLLGKTATGEDVTAGQSMLDPAQKSWNELTNINAAIPLNADHRAAFQHVFGNALPIEVYRRQHAAAVKKLVFNANTLEEVRTQSAALDPQVRAALVSFAERHLPASGQIGSGVYSARDTKIFTDIASALGAQRPVGFVTAENIGKSEGKGKSANEPMRKGIVGKHVYAVLDTFEENVMLRRKFVKACNPWGSYGRAYTDNGPSITAKEQEAGIFWMELRDLVVSATRLEIGPPLNLEQMMS